MILSLSFEEVMFNSPHYVFWKDKNSVYLGCNKNFAELAGFDSPEKIIGKVDFELWQINREEAEIFRQGDIDTMKDNPLVDAKESISQPDSTTWTMLANKRPLTNKKHNIVGIFGIGINITPQKLINDIPLSKRQSDCLYYLVRGMTAKQIAKALNLSNRTVEFYLENIKDKFKCESKSDLIAKAIEMGFGKT